MNRKQREAFIAALSAAFVVEIVCNEALPAAYRRDFFRQEMKRADNVASEHIFERVMGRLSDADPLTTLLGWAS